MGRKFPVGETNAVNHPFISVSLYIACIAATMAIVSSLCGTLSRKRSEPSSVANEMKENRDGNLSSSDGLQNNSSKEQSGIAKESGDDAALAQPQQNDEDLVQQPLPPPPGRRHLSGTVSCHFISDSTASTSSSSQTKLLSSMSMRVFGNGMASRQASKREDNGNKKKEKTKLKHEDSIWMKTIILGEKCKVPDEVDNTILYGEKGNIISTYHPKTSKPLSRQSSISDPDLIPKEEFLQRN